MVTRNWNAGDSFEEIPADRKSLNELENSVR